MRTLPVHDVYINVSLPGRPDTCTITVQTTVLTISNQAPVSGDLCRVCRLTARRPRRRPPHTLRSARRAAAARQELYL